MDMKSELSFLVKVSVNIRQLVLSFRPKTPHHTRLCRPGWKVPPGASHSSPSILSDHARHSDKDKQSWT